MVYVKYCIFENIESEMSLETKIQGDFIYSLNSKLTLSFNSFRNG